MTDQLNPDDFVITRRRKKYKFAKFANATNCFEHDDYITRRTSSNSSKKVLGKYDVVEIGAGTGLFSVELASRSPEKNFVALDVKADRLQKGAYAAIERGLENIEFVRARADQIMDLFEESSIHDIWVTFADPFAKKRNAARRLTHQKFLQLYKQLLTPTGTLHIKHDNPEFFAWSLEQLVAEGWAISELLFDIHDSDRQMAAQILTTYEQRWLGEGRTTSYVAARAPRTAAATGK
jgi:tRNA (guanine-N7-)-methyltransferase